MIPRRSYGPHNDGSEFHKEQPGHGHDLDTRLHPAQRTRPTFFTSPRGDVPVFGKFYRNMERELEMAVDAIARAATRIEERHRLIFDAEASPIRWFYHTAGPHANFYESCHIRDRLVEIAALEFRSSAVRDEARGIYRRWREILENEKANTLEALPVVEADMRLDF